jgi:excinuclease ABC subunit C
VKTQDDYSYMAEILTRRYENNSSEQPYPDLLMVDGGKGQLNIALDVIRNLGIDDHFDVIGIAKKDEERGDESDKIYKANRSNPMNFGRDGDLLLFLQAIRDEAHRFAITFHRSRRSVTSRLSVLDGIPGIGPKRKKALLAYFEGVDRLKKAAVSEVAEVAGISVAQAENILNTLNKASED